MADESKVGEKKTGLKETIAKHKVAFGVTIVAIVVLVIFLWSRNNNAQSQNPNQITGANSLVPSAVAVPGPAGPTGPEGPKGPRGPRGPKGNKGPINHICPPGMHWDAARNRCVSHRPATKTGSNPPLHMQPIHTAGMPAFPNHATFHPQNPAAKR